MVQYMLRAIELAAKGAGNVAPNPMVGAVLVYDNRILGEGYHQKFGYPHAEVNCISSVSQEDQDLISLATMFVTLEPCSHFGKTPPCADLIIRHNIKKVVVGCGDPFMEVNGRGIEKLRSSGIDVIVPFLETVCIKLNKRFFLFHQQKRPYVILKWAESGDGKITGDDFRAMAISNPVSNRLVHKWRAEEGAIMIGTNTALYDNPLLSTRLWKGANPIRVVLDSALKLSKALNVFDHQIKTIIYNKTIDREEHNLAYVKVDTSNIITSILLNLYERGIQSLIVEGGQILLQTFIDSALWDEARVIKNAELTIGNGLKAPILTNSVLMNQEQYGSDLISYFENKGLDKLGIE